MIAVHANEQDRNRIFQKNVQLLPDYLKKQIQAVQLEDVWSQIDIVYSKEGYPICRMKKDGNFIHINSIDPLGQAKDWCNQLPFEKIRTLFMYGCGFGYSLPELLKKLHLNSVIVVFELNVYIFVAMLHYFDLESVFRTGQFLFFVGHSEQIIHGFLKVISTIDLLYFTAPSIVHSPYARMYKTQYIELQDVVLDRLADHVSMFERSNYRPLLGFHNMLENVHEVLNNPYFSSLKDTYKDKPAFIIANGPSLDQDIHLLGEIKGKGLILCCESAIVSLMKYDLKPDAICVLDDRPKDYHYHFENREYPEDIALLANVGADPRIFSSFAGPKMPIFLREATNMINHELGDGTAIEGGLSVAHFAYEAAVYMGANPIVLIGQDLAYGSDGVTHSRHSIYAKEQLKETVEKIKSDRVIYVESNDGKRIPSNRTWHEFKLTFERLIERHPEVNVINTTLSGARIKGTLCEKLEKVIEIYCQKQMPNRLDELINTNKDKVDLSIRWKKKDNLLIEFQKNKAIFCALEGLVAQKRAICEQILEKTEDKEYPAMLQELNLTYKQNTKAILELLSPHLGIYLHPVILLGGHRMNLLGPARSIVKMREAIEIQFELFDHMHLICQSLVRSFDQAYQRLLLLNQ